MNNELNLRIQQEVANLNIDSLKVVEPVVPADIMAEAQVIADSIIAELRLDEMELEFEAMDAMSITTGRKYDDIVDENEEEKEKIARLKRLIAEGRYEIDHEAIAKSLMDADRV